MNGIKDLAKYGLTGVCIALIILLGFSFKLFYNYATEKINENTQIIQKNIETQQELISTVKKLDELLRNKLEANINELWEK